MSASRGPAMLGRSLLWGAAATGALAWADAVWMANGAVPPIGLRERCVLAAQSGLRLLIPVLGTILVLWTAWWLLSRRKAAAGGAGPASTKIVLPACAFWTVGIFVLARAGYGERWKIKALLWAVAAAGAAYAYAAWRGSRAGKSARLAGLAALVIWAPGLAALAGPQVLPAPDGPLAASQIPHAPSYILVVIDALRADHLGAYGYARPTSPDIDALAASGTLFERAISPASWTLPAMASIFTSIYPARHGADRENARLPANLPSLASELERAGYRTGGFATNPWLDRAFGFGRGFEDYFDNARLTLKRETAGFRLKNMFLRALDRIRRDPEEYPQAMEVTERGVRWLRRSDGRPFFLYLHYMDVHHPYLSVPPYRGLFCKGHHFDLPDPELEYRFRMHTIPRDPQVLDHMIERYDETIRAADDAIGRLVRSVGRMGLADDTTLIVTADHGEEFYDHGGTGHRRTVYQEVVRVPLIVTRLGRTGGKPAVLTQRVSTLDILPTLLEWSGVEPPRSLAGISLASLLEPVSGVAHASIEESTVASGERVIGSQLYYKGRAWTALFLGNDKLIRVLPPATQPGAEDRLELYHLDRDPGEHVNEVAEDPARTQDLVSVMRSLDPVWGTPGMKPLQSGPPINSETLDKLKGLGYIK